MPADAAPLAPEVSGAGWGPLELSGDGDGYAGPADWLGAEVELTLELFLVPPAWEGRENTPEAAASAAETADALWADQAKWDAAARDRAADDLLDQANEWANQAGDPPHARAGFLALLELAGVVCGPGGAWSLHFEDGDDGGDVKGLFWGHGVQVNGTLADGPTDASMG